LFTRTIKVTEKMTRLAVSFSRGFTKIAEFGQMQQPKPPCSSLLPPISKLIMQLKKARSCELFGVA
jgi:hypothetical protein